MTRDEIVTALRCCASLDCEYECRTTCAFYTTSDELGDCCTKKNTAAADLIENQQRHIDALLQANAGLRDTIIRRDAQIEKMREDLQSAKNTADQHAAIGDTLYDSNAKLAADRKALVNELCQYCGKYKKAHEGACNGCKWRDM